MSAAEMDWVQGSTRLASLVFSAKEAIYKAYYPHFRHPANFKDVRLLSYSWILQYALSLKANTECFSEDGHKDRTVYCALPFY